MYDFIYDLILENRYASIFILMALFANESVMPFVGYAASFGHVSALPAIAAGTLGSTFGSVIIYTIGRVADQEAVYRFVYKYGKWLGISKKKIDKAGRWFDRNAKAAVFAAKFVPGVRTALSLTAGFRRMPFGSFLFFTLLGTAISSAILTYVGYTANARFDDLAAAVSGISTFLILLFFSLVLVLIIRRQRRR